jgi:V8-like Glu-specific endopeptidase
LTRKVRLAATFSSVACLALLAFSLPATGVADPPSDPWAPLPVPSHPELSKWAEREVYRVLQNAPNPLPLPNSGNVSGATVFSPDDRVPITDQRLITNSVAKWVTLNIALFDNDTAKICSGLLLNWNAGITAAHCLYDRQSLSVAAAVLVVPGATIDAFGRPVFPYGGGVDYIEDFAIPRGWVEAPEPESLKYDIALIKIREASWDAPQIGPFPTVSAPWIVPIDPRLFRQDFRLMSMGYPESACGESGCQMVGQVQPASSAWYPDEVWGEPLFGTSIDGEPGQSGSAVILVKPEGSRAYWPYSSTAVVMGVLTGQSPTRNWGVMFTSEVVTALVSYCQSRGCSFAYSLASPAPTPTPTATPTPTPTPTPTRSPTPTPTPTPTPPTAGPHRVVVPGLTRN